MSHTRGAKNRIVALGSMRKMVLGMNSPTNRMSKVERRVCMSTTKASWFHTSAMTGSSRAAMPIP